MEENMSADFELHSQLAADTAEVMELPLSKLLLMNDSNYPWFILVPKRANISEVYQLDWEDQMQLLNESSMLTELLQQEFNGDKMNVAALGNMVPQLHVHHIVRFKNDVAWPKPVWGLVDAKPYTDSELTQIVMRVTEQLDAILKNDS